MIRKILLVDDEAVSTLFLSAVLTDEGYEVKGTATSSEALNVSTTFIPDLLLADWILKDGCDGLHVAKELLKQIPHLQVIFLTGLEKESIEEKAKEVPHLAIIQKPLDVDLLSKLIREAGEQVNAALA